MRTGIFISAVSHVALVALMLLGTPKLFQSAPLETIEVDLVQAAEAEPEPPPLEPEKKPPDKTKEWSPFPEASAAPAKPPTPEGARTQSETKQQQQSQPTQPVRVQQPSKQAAQKEPTPQTRTPPQTPPVERPTQQVLATPTPSPPAEPPAQQSQPWIFDPMNIPALMNLPNGGPQADFDSEATATANLSGDERLAFKEHLKKCLKLPGGMSESTRVTLRIFLKRDGGLASEPVLIEGSASSDGPRLMQAAIRSVKECQPFAFLPADRYREWKTLDVSFSPKDMAGG